ncbi:hypothetical protein BRC77_05340 [Halobacteriales archaeon QH_8_64_26]|nr:MAG: hypothetical protein BRC77_05340 [Halobacteriales archaeon QH_8_64_26]
MEYLVLQGGAFGSNVFGPAIELLPIVAGLVLVLMIVAFSAFVYRSLTGGIEWPTDADEEADDESVTRSHDDEWKYS